MKFVEPFVEQQKGDSRNAFRPRLPHRIVALGFLSRSVPAAQITDQLAKALSAETAERVVLVRWHEGAGQESLATRMDDQSTVVDWASSELVLQGQFRPGTLFRTKEGFERLHLDLSSQRASPESIRFFLSQLARHFRYVLIEVFLGESPAPALLQPFLCADTAYLFIEPTSGEARHVGQIVRELCALDHNDPRPFKPVFCTTQGGSEPELDAAVKALAMPRHRFVRNCPSALTPGEPVGEADLDRFFKNDLRRLAREISGRLVGLALSSGAAKGFSHIGVIQVLEENGIEVDVIAGASIGAYIGAVWASGRNGGEMEKLARELERRWDFWQLIDPVIPPRQGFLRGIALKKRLMRTIGDARFIDLERPLRVIAGNLATLENIAFASGEVATAVHASMAVPGICVPVTIDGEAYIDGGIVEPVPVDVLREMGACHVIAVNTIPTPERMRESIEAERELARRKETRMRRLFRRALRLDRQLNYFAQGNLFEILVRSIHGAQIRLAEASCRKADLMLHPDVCDDRWLDCRNPGRFIALGREVAERQLAEIKTLVNKNAFTYEQELAPNPVAAVA